ncbi:uncharacterized protein LOC117102327 [Anneissia japonica]|uniref:uncharacterized protein LOC117102327 n=1 Tax=Anneissia japonica TaxID=1529436 RepID=UPI0014259941|nr:uncharacterized protein LOC117102327 [Anneissia japonica]
METQFGFRRERGCNDGIYVTKQLQEIANLSQRRLFTCYVDLSAAFDHVNQSFLFQSIRNRIPYGEQTDNIDVIEGSYAHTEAYLANTEPSTNREQRRREPMNGTFEDSKGGYADDIGIHSWSKDGLQSIVNILFEVLAEFGLTMNVNKTETMVWNWSLERYGPYPSHLIKVNDIWIINSKIFKYLGVWNTYDDIPIGNREMDHRISSARASFAKHRKMLCNKSIALSTRVTFLNGLVRSRLTYGCHSWRPLQSELNKLNFTYNYFLRSIIVNGFERQRSPVAACRVPSIDEEEDERVEKEPDDDADWSFKINNKKLFSIVKTISIQDFYSQQQVNWIAHVIRRENSNPCKKLTFQWTKVSKRGRKNSSIIERATAFSGLSRNQFIRDCFLKRKF